MEMPSCCYDCFMALSCEERDKADTIDRPKGLFNRRISTCPLTLVPEHNDLADKSVIIERMGAVYEALYDKVDKKALSECHVAFLKAVMYAPTVIPSTDSAMVLERTT